MSKTKAIPVLGTQGAWASGLSEAPVFIDGIDHELFYLIAATKNSAENYTAVVIGRFNDNRYKVKFYGSFAEWGFNEASLADKFRAEDFLSRTKYHYQRYMTDKLGVRAIMKALAETRGVAVAPIEKLGDAFNTSQKERAEVAKVLHPHRGAARPALPFAPPALLAKGQ